ncbi:DUF2249 domain-containing protein [Leeia sp. TBRC 13508]|uniref:DUF2249 domain-containing protein n=1 Tax=Leeia speluncae TaxID=2884804 RepID=A0ABS8D8P8_9NEIS|nr:DUF2249 domain-containing protein [Leeia speluncae]MCB6184580.1 DUF2249 domain-containing protein [Leeia speluncae]
MKNDCTLPIIPNGTYTFDARGIARRIRHAAIFGALSELKPGESMRFLNDHDPVPLLKQIELFFGSRIKTVYRHRSPGEIVIDFHIEAHFEAAAY